MNNQTSQKLEAFATQTKKFEAHMDFFQSIKAEMKFEANREAKITMSGVKEEPLIAVLVHFRNFYMKSSNLYFPEIAKIILDDDSILEHHELTKKFLDAWNQLLSPEMHTVGGMMLKLGKNPLSGKRNLDVWMNEEYLHVDQYNPGSYKGLDAIKSQHVFESLSKISMVDLLQRLSGLIIAFNSQVVEKILSK